MYVTILTVFFGFALRAAYVYFTTIVNINGGSCTFNEACDRCGKHRLYRAGQPKPRPARCAICKCQ